MSSAGSLGSDLKSLALLLGFDLAGIARLPTSADGERFQQWLARGYAGEMDYLARRADDRLDPSRLLPGARTALALGFVYGPDPAAPAATPMGAESGDAAARGRVARYAAGEDYHEVLGDRLSALVDAVEARAGHGVGARAYVDTGPVMERALARAAGLGWVGKNTCLIHPALGSYLFLAVVLLDVDLEPDTPEPDHCGTCTACLDACPTDAFPEPYVLDARRCIAYTTIESRGAIPEELRDAHGDWIFGCDICQEVCPWNRRRPALDDPLGLRARIAPTQADAASLRPTLEWLLGLEESAWRDATTRSPLRRARHRGLLRNALVAAGNSGEKALLPRLDAIAAGSDLLLAEHASWAARRLRQS